jgi:hypothetical protein
MMNSLKIVPFEIHVKYCLYLTDTNQKPNSNENLMYEGQSNENGLEAKTYYRIFLTSKVWGEIWAVGGMLKHFPTKSL